MFDALIKSLLGSWGTVVLDFVLKYQVIISIAAVAFGVVIIIRRRRKESAEKAETDTRDD